jgi:hypothetical protein
MAKRNYTPERIIRKLREVAVLLNQGTTTHEVTRETEASQQIYYPWGR